MAIGIGVALCLMVGASHAGSRAAGTMAPVVDGDGGGLVSCRLDDGSEACPALPRDTAMSGGEDAEILQRAIFAVSAVGGSRHAPLVTEPRVHVEGYGGPALYVTAQSSWTGRHGEGGVFITWRVAARSAREAAVDVTNHEGMLAGGGQRVYLRRIGGRWIAVGRARTFIS